MATLEYYWDVASPFTYLANTQLAALAARTGAKVVAKPFLLGGVFKATGNEAPASVLAKAVYLNADIQRWRDTYSVPMKLPSELPFPINSVLPMRAAIAVPRVLADAYRDSVFSAYWEQGRDVSDPAVLTDVLTKIGADAAAILEATQDPAVKAKLRANTEEAVKRGAFGAPAFFVDGDHYWGNDRLNFLEKRLID